MSGAETTPPEQELHMTISTTDQPTITDAIAEIERRGGETQIDGRYGSSYLEIISRGTSDGQPCVLLVAEGWRRYGSRHPARRACLGYLVGIDDAGIWAVRVPGTMRSVSEAVRWLTPREVVTARMAGRTVLRQGDVYVIEARVDRMADTRLPRGHEWRPETRYLVHRPSDGRKHKPVKVAFPARVVPQRAYRMGRSGRRGAAD